MMCLQQEAEKAQLLKQSACMGDVTPHCRKEKSRQIDFNDEASAQEGCRAPL